MGTKSFSPTTRKQAERVINRIQDRFDAGMFADLPKTSIPDNGVAYLKNFVNRGDRLEGRTGSRRWGNWSTNTAHAELPIINTFTATVENNAGFLRVYNAIGYEFSSSDLNNFIVITKDGNNYHYRITDINSVLEVETGDNIFLPDGTDITGSQTVSMRGKINGFYYHKGLSKVLLHIGTKLYTADDIQMSGWTEVYGESYSGLSDDISSIIEYENRVYIGCTNGIYTVDLTNHGTEPLLYFKINSKCPTTSGAVASPSIYTYRYTYTMCKLGNDGGIKKNRATTPILVESGSCYLNENSIDYEMNGSPVEKGSGGGESILSTFQIPFVTDTKTEKHWTSFGVYRTLDLGDNGIDPITDEENNPSLFIWAADIPLFKIMVGDVNPGGIVSVTEGEASDFDNYVTVYTPTHSYSAINVDESGNEFELYPYGGSGSTDEVFVIGTESYTKITCVDNVVTKTSGYGVDFTEDDVGKMLFLSDGTYLHINSYIDADNMGIVEDTEITTSIHCCWETTSGGVDLGTNRIVYEDTPDDDLRPRISTYPLYQRFYEELPNTDIVRITSGFMFGSIRTDNTLYYSQIPDQFEYLVGYYHPYYQSQKFSDNVRGLGVFPNRLAVYCANSTHIIPTNTLSTVELPEVGNLIAIITGVIQADANVGVLDDGGIYDLDIGKQILITNEPGIRIFDGETYSPNIASERISTILKSFKAGFSCVYIPYMGFILWGSDE